MNPLLKNIKSKYSLRNIFNYLPFHKTFKLTYGCKYLIEKIEFSKKVSEKIKEYQVILKSSSSYDIKKYLNYFDINLTNKNEKNEVKEILLYKSLNNACFTVTLIIGNENWDLILKNIQNIKIIISPYLFLYLNNLDLDKREDIYKTLNAYKNNITEITTFNFQKQWSLKPEIIKRILEFLNRIFQSKNEDNIIISNENHRVKKISFESNEIPNYLCISEKIFEKINNIISLSKLEDIFIDSSSFNDIQFTDIMKYITNNLRMIKKFKLNTNFNMGQFADFNMVCSNINEKIECIDLSYCPCSDHILTIINNKQYPLKEFKINLFSFERKKINFDFLEKNKESLEVLEIIMKGKIEYFYIKNLIFSLNKMKKLRVLKLIGLLKIEYLYYFEKNENLENLEIDFDISHYKLNLVNQLKNFFAENFVNLKSFTLSEIKNSYHKNRIIKDDSMLFSFIFPPKLKTLNLKNLFYKNLISILKENQDNVNLIEDLTIEGTELICETIFTLLTPFKNLRSFSFINNSTMINLISSIIKNNSSIIELNISGNKCIEHYSDILKYGNGEKLKNALIIIKNALPKKFLNLKIFNENTCLSINNFSYLMKLFGPVLDLENIYVKN